MADTFAAGPKKRPYKPSADGPVPHVEEPLAALVRWLLVNRVRGRDVNAATIGLLLRDRPYTAFARFKPGSRFSDALAAVAGVQVVATVHGSPVYRASEEYARDAAWRARDEAVISTLEPAVLRRPHGSGTGVVGTHDGAPAGGAGAVSDRPPAAPAPRLALPAMAAPYMPATAAPYARAPVLAPPLPPAAPPPPALCAFTRLFVLGARLRKPGLAVTWPLMERLLEALPTCRPLAPGASERALLAVPEVEQKAVDASGRAVLAVSSEYMRNPNAQASDAAALQTVAPGAVPEALASLAAVATMLPAVADSGSGTASVPAFTPPAAPVPAAGPLPPPKPPKSMDAIFSSFVRRVIAEVASAGHAVSVAQLAHLVSTLPSCAALVALLNGVAVRDALAAVPCVAFQLDRAGSEQVIVTPDYERNYSLHSLDTQLVAHVAPASVPEVVNALLAPKPVVSPGLFSNGLASGGFAAGAAGSGANFSFNGAPTAPPAGGSGSGAGGGSLMAFLQRQKAHLSGESAPPVPAVQAAPIASFAPVRTSEAARIGAAAQPPPLPRALAAGPPAAAAAPRPAGGAPARPAAAAADGHRVAAVHANAAGTGAGSGAGSDSYAADPPRLAPFCIFLRCLVRRAGSASPPVEINLQRLGTIFRPAEYAGVRAAWQAWGPLGDAVRATPGIHAPTRNRGGHPVLAVTPAYAADAAWQARDEAAVDAGALRMGTKFFGLTSAAGGGHPAAVPGLPAAAAPALAPAPARLPAGSAPAGGAPPPRPAAPAVRAAGRAAWDGFVRRVLLDFEARQPGKRLMLVKLGTILGTLAPVRPIRALQPSAATLREAVLSVPHVLRVGTDPAGGHPILSVDDEYRGDAVQQALDADAAAAAAPAALQAALASLGAASSTHGHVAAPSVAPGAAAAATAAPIAAPAHTATPAARPVKAKPAKAAPANGGAGGGAAGAGAGAGLEPARPEVFCATLRQLLRRMAEVGRGVDLMNLGHALTLPDCRGVRDSMKAAAGPAGSLRRAALSAYGVVEAGRDARGGHPILGLAPETAGDAMQGVLDVALADARAVDAIFRYLTR